MDSVVGEHHRFIARRVGDKVELVRDFGGMYREIDDPHGQQASAANLAHDVYLDLIVRLLQSVHPEPAPVRYVDVGSGLGYVTARVADVLRGAGRRVEAVGFDVAASAVERATARFGKDGGVQFTTGSLLDDALSSKIPPADLVTCFETLYYFKDEEIAGVARTLASLVRPGGLLAVSYHLPEQMGYGRYVRSLADLRGLFGTFTPLWEMDFTDAASTIYDGGVFGRHLFTVFRNGARARG